MRRPWERRLNEDSGVPRADPIASLSEHEIHSWQGLASRAIQPNPFFEPEFVRAAAKDLDRVLKSLAVVQDGRRWHAAMPATKVIRLDGRAIGSYIYLPRHRAAAQLLHLPLECLNWSPR